jgi:hypothetical protein
VYSYIPDIGSGASCHGEVIVARPLEEPQQESPILTRSTAYRIVLGSDVHDTSGAVEPIVTDTSNPDGTVTRLEAIGGVTVGEDCT